MRNWYLSSNQEYSGEKTTTEMQTPDEPRRKYCANCGKEIRPGQGIELNHRYSVCSEECRKEFNKGKIL